MRRKELGLKVLMFAVLAVICLTGCESRYQKIEIEAGRVVEAGVVLQSGAGETVREVAAGSYESDSRTEADQTETDQNDTGSVEAESSAVNAERAASAPAEEAPVMTEIHDTVYVTADQVNVRTGASISSQVVGKADTGAEFARTGYDETWSRIQYQGRECYIASRYVSTEKTEAAFSGEIKLDSSWKYAEFSKINSGSAYLYRSQSANRNGITICVNAGHGTSGGSSVKTLCHPDGTPKVTGGTTGAGATTAVAVSGGMTFSDGTPEAKVTLAMARKLKEKLLEAGYDVLMIRETDDVQLDNIARTVIANNRADCHIALHWDSTTSDKGAFYMSVPNVESYRSMEPVKSNWQKHNALGESLVAGLKAAGVKIFSGGAMEMDLTQTSYSTVPSVDIELGDKASDHSEATLKMLAEGLVDGVNRYFGQ